MTWIAQTAGPPRFQNEAYLADCPLLHQHVDSPAESAASAESHGWYDIDIHGSVTDLHLQTLSLRISYLVQEQQR